jgi:Uma2 family endonuclease
MMLPAASTIHASVSHKLVLEFGYFIKKRKGKCKVFSAPFDVRLPNKSGETANDKVYTVVQPDICLICDSSKIDDKGCLGAPDLVIEILSRSNWRYDVTEKFDTYQSTGVLEYWIASPKDETITVHLLQPDGKYDCGTTYKGDEKVPVQSLKGLKIDLEEVFGDFKSSYY